MAERAEALGSGLLQQGCKPSTKQFIGVFAQNRPEVRFEVQLDALLIMFLTCELALYLKVVLKCVKSASMTPFSPSCHDVLLQWIISELACYTYSMVVVPLYDTLGPGAIRYIVNTGKNKIDVIFSETSFVARNGLFSSAFQILLIECLEVT